mgnify:CR=1 FL=1
MDALLFGGVHASFYSLSLLRHDLTLCVGEPDNTAAQTGAGTSFGANGDQHTRAAEPSTYFCVLTIRKQLPGNGFERSGRGQEPSRGHKFSILENSCPFGTASCWGVPAPNPAGTSTANWNLTNPTCASYYTHVIILYINSFSISKLNLIFAVR